MTGTTHGSNILHLKNKKRPAQIFMHKKSWGGSSSSSRIVCYENCIVHAFFILMVAAELRK